MKNKLLKEIPKVDLLLEKIEKTDGFDKIPRPILLTCCREVLGELREAILSGEVAEFSSDSISADVLKLAAAKSRTGLRKTINASGIVLHTNLGRAVLSREVADHVATIASSYSNLEFDILAGKRGSRYSHIESLLCELSGAEAALVVNNNAAAVLLILSAIARGKEVIVSRGELVEIGGSFRVPDIMSFSGAKLREIGTTNRTHLADYEQAIDPQETAALLKVHTSNFKIIGFTAAPSIEELAALAKDRGLPLIYDLGAGSFLPLKDIGIAEEVEARKFIAAGVDILSFSGDKLLASAQAGIILGKKKYIDIMKKHPFTRAVRIDKLALAALEASLRLALDPDTFIEKTPALAMIAAKVGELRIKATALEKAIELRKISGLTIEIMDGESQVGAGSVPGETIPTVVLSLSSERFSIIELEAGLRLFDTAIIARIYKERLILDLRTIFDEDFAIIADALLSIHK